MQLNPSITPDNDTRFMLEALADQQFGSDFTTRFRTGYVSWIDIGGYSSRQMNGERVTINCQNDFFWSMANYGVKFGIDDAFAYKWSEEE